MIPSIQLVIDRSGISHDAELGDLGNGRSLDSETLAARLRAVLVKDVARGGPP